MFYDHFCFSTTTMSFENFGILVVVVSFDQFYFHVSCLLSLSRCLVLMTFVTSLSYMVHMLRLEDVRNRGLLC